jgi:DNA-binding transcriptional LysR family regulator
MSSSRPGGGSFSAAIDLALSAVGVTRRVALSAASFLFVPEIIARSDLIAFVPSRLLHPRADRLAIFEPPIKVPSFAISLLWHDRTHDHPAHAWVRSKITQWMSPRVPRE